MLADVTTSIDEMDRAFYLLMLQLEDVLTFSVADTYEIPMFVDLSIKADH